jgi:hypothetical protein
MAIFDPARDRLIDSGGGGASSDFDLLKRGALHNASTISIRTTRPKHFRRSARIMKMLWGANPPFRHP